MPATAASSIRAFFANTAPSRQALTDLIHAAITMRQRRSFLPEASSVAMAELNAEAGFRGSWGNEPVRQVHNAGEMLIAAAEESIECGCRLLSQEPLPVFGHIVLARAALEACGRAQWLYEPEIDVRRRVARGMTERLYSLEAQARLADEVGDHTRIETRRRSILNEAARQGFTIKGKKLTAIGEPRLGATETVEHALGDGSDPALGRVLFGYFSAVSHGTVYGLVQSMDVVRSEEPLRPDTIGHLKTDSGAVNSVVAAMVLAYIEVVERERKLFGWQDDQWATAVIRALTAVRRALPS